MGICQNTCYQVYKDKSCETTKKDLKLQLNEIEKNESISQTYEQKSVNQLVDEDIGQEGFSKIIKDSSEHQIKNDLSSPDFQYYGERKNQMKHGKGTQIWVDGTKYQGDWKNDKPDGNLFNVDFDKALGNQLIHLAIHMRVIDRTEKQMVWELIFILTALATQVNGRMINSMAMELKLFKMVQYMKADMKMDKNLEKENYYLKINHFMKDNLLMIALMVLGFISELMAENMKGNGKTIK